MASSSSSTSQTTYRRDEWGIISFAVFLIVVGAFWLGYPNLWNEIGSFIADLKPVNVGGVPVFVEPAGNHSSLYATSTAFFIVLGVWLFILTGLRWYTHSQRRMISETFTRAVFLLGLGILSYELQVAAFQFRTIVPLIVVLAGATLVVRGLWNLFFLKGNI